MAELDALRFLQVLLGEHRTAGRPTCAEADKGAIELFAAPPQCYLIPLQLSWGIRPAQTSS
jgi:hypothetical protein